MAGETKNRINLGKKARILLISLTGIGNLIMLTPAFANIKKNLPESELYVMVSERSVHAARNNPHIDKLILYPSKKNFIQKMIFLLKLRKNNYDLAYYSFPNRNILSDIFLFLTGAKEKINYYYPLFGIENFCFSDACMEPDLKRHDLEKGMDLLRLCNLKIYSKKPVINPSMDDYKFIEGLLKNKASKSDILIGMHVGTIDNEKIWPTENFAHVAKELAKNKNTKIILIGSEIEKNLVRNFGEFRHRNVINLIGKTSVLQTAALLKKCRLLVTNDSGPMHIAVAVDTKVVAIFLASDIRRTGPYDKKHIVLSKRGYYDKSDGNKNHIYTDNITPELVLSQIRKILKAK
ncbi:glycosyltransferase family 9 protein [Candidatus Woesearchaeota archaeon]|nr:glycosyltransferase family 9 protein [Candidatus Woesearchaeota archaeon]